VQQTTARLSVPENDDRQDVAARIDAALAVGPRRLALDMSRVGRLSSTDVALLLRVVTECESRGVEVVLRHPSRSCRDVLTSAGMTAFVTVEAARHPRRHRGPESGVDR
jgi:anti-anti-sigma factor